MPTYDYECDACSHAYEVYQSITAKPLKKCPACGKPKLRRLIGAGGGVIFKGSGFYQTDYRSDSYKKAAEAESKPADSDKKSETKADGKAASTSGESKPAKQDPPKKKDTNAVAV